LANLERPTAQDISLQAGIALHYGEVSYGNIGSGRRLDFTVIGPDVNLVSRIQTATGATGHALLSSERFAGLLGSQKLVSIGRHALKGFSDSVELYRQIDGTA
jgi:adenylate cyclase